MAARLLLATFLGIAASAACATPDAEPEVGTTTRQLGGSMALHVEGHNFVRADGTPIWLAGMADCCADTLEHPFVHPSGWPWVSDYWIGRAANRANWVTLRLGPHHRRNECPDAGPGDACAFDAYRFDPGSQRYDLDHFNDAYWQMLVDRLAAARAAGVYVEVDLIDAWTLKEAATNVWRNGDPDEYCTPASFTTPIGGVQRRWLDKIGQTLAPLPHDHLIFQVANEPYGCPGIDAAWQRAVEDVLHEYLPDAVVGINVDGNALPSPNQVGYASYVSVHQDPPMELVFGDIPTGVNEATENHSLSPEAYTDALWRGFVAGTFFHYWWGDSSEGEVEATLDRIAAFQQIIASVDFRRFKITPLSADPWIVTGDPLGGVYVGYHASAAEGEVVTVDVGDSDQIAYYTWYRASDGAPIAGGAVSGSGRLPFELPASGQLALRISTVFFEGPIDPGPCDGPLDCDDEATAAACPDQCRGDEPDCPADVAPQSFTVEPTDALAGVPVVFTADLAAITPNTIPLWDLGTGEHTDGSPYTHVYNDPGIYTVILTSNDAVCHTTVLTYQTVKVYPRASPSCSEIAEQYGYEFAGCGNWEQSCDNLPGTGSYGPGFDCPGTVCCARNQPPDPCASNSGHDHSGRCGGADACGHTFGSSTDCGCPGEAASCHGASCGAIGGDECRGTPNACPAGYQNLGSTYDCASCCDYIDPCASESGHDHSGSCGETDACGHSFGSADDCGCPGEAASCHGASCGAIGGDECRGTPNACPGGYQNLGSTYDCASCCDYIDPCASESGHDHSGRCGETDACGHSFGSADDCGCPGEAASCHGPSCGAIGGDECRGTPNSCPGGYQNLGSTYDCASCCDYTYVDPCASDGGHDHSGSCGSTDTCGHTFGGWTDCGCPGASVIYDTCYEETCTDQWAWVEDTCTGTNWTHEWCDDCWWDCHLENYDDWVCDWTCGSYACNWTEEPYEYACNGRWEVIGNECHSEPYPCNPHSC